jgi:hypothetical protein
MLFPKPVGNTAIESFLLYFLNETSACERAKLFAYVNNNIDIKRILQDKQFHLQLKSEQKEIIQNVLERKDSMAANYIVTLPRYFSFRLPHLNIPTGPPSDELDKNIQRTSHFLLLNHCGTIICILKAYFTFERR